MEHTYTGLDNLRTEELTSRLQELCAIKRLHKDRKKRLPQKERRELIDALYSVIQSTREEQGAITESAIDNIEVITSDTDVALALICEGLKEKGYDGRLIPIGSSYDGTRASAGTDLDYLYELRKLPTAADVNDIQLETTDTPHTRRLLINEEELTSRQVYKEFSRTLDYVCNTVDVGYFPRRLTFGGFAQPRFSGVRDNQPAATILFRWQDHTGDWINIPVDISVALRLPCCTGISDKIDTHPLASSDASNGLHLVPVLGAKSWHVTTAILEQKILKDIQTACPVTTIKECKTAVQCITRDLNALCLSDTTPREKTKEYQEWLLASFKQYNSSESKNDELRKLLAKQLYFSHIVLTDEVTREFYEIPAKYLSFNSSAIKYKLLTDTILSDRPPEGPSSPAVSPSSPAVSLSNLELIASVVRFPAKHSFLSYEIRAFGVNLALVTIQQLLSVGEKYKQQQQKPQNFKHQTQHLEQTVIFVIIIIIITLYYDLFSECHRTYSIL